MKSIFSMGRAHRWRLILLLLVVIFLMRLLYSYFVPAKLPKLWYKREGPEKNSAFIYWTHDLVVLDYMKKRNNWPTTNLGTMLFKDRRKIFQETKQTPEQFTVLIWKAGPSLEPRHIYNYGTIRKDPLKKCSVKNCVFTYEEKEISSADAVLVHLHKNQIPNATYRRARNRTQLWIFLTDESPEHTTMNMPRNSWVMHANIFNWSMSYRTDADIPVPYGRVVPLPTAQPPGGLTDHGLVSLIPHWESKRRDALVAILISNCSNRRMKFVRQLMKHVTVHVYGQCSDNAKDACPGSFHEDCPAINNYYFYLAFENSRCFQYITEKVFYNSYSKGAIPVIIGSDIDSVTEILPPYSFIYADEYTDAEKLANVLINLGKNEKDMLAYHSWRHHFEVLNEHGYFKTPSVHYCRVCEALNYNDRSVSIYDKEMLRKFLDPDTLCKNELE